MPNNKKEIYIIRHGETEFNRLGIVQGSGVDTDLNEKGRKQAQAFYNKYKNHGFDKIYATALKRTHQTVESFVNDGHQLEILPEFNEISWGTAEGKKPTAENQKYYEYLLASWAEGNTSFAAEGGESPEFVAKRQTIGLEKLLRNKDEKRILLAMHGRAMRILLTQITNQPLKNMDTFPHQNTCLYQVLYDNDLKTFEIISKNNIEHLEESNLLV